jgi:hypothetical protein
VAIERRDGRTEKVEAELREWALPEEMLPRTRSPWTGGFRWFASPDVVPLEHYRDREQTARILNALRQRKREREARAISEMIRKCVSDC